MMRNGIVPIGSLGRTPVTSLSTGDSKKSLRNFGSSPSFETNQDARPSVQLLRILRTVQVYKGSSFIFE